MHSSLYPAVIPLSASRREARGAFMAIGSEAADKLPYIRGGASVYMPRVPSSRGLSTRSPREGVVYALSLQSGIYALLCT